MKCLRENWFQNMILVVAATTVILYVVITNIKSFIDINF